MASLLLNEIAWINANAHLYESEIHKNSVIGNITKRYRIKELEASIKPFADYFEGDLKDVGGGTVIAPEMTMQPFKKAKEVLSKNQ